VEGEESDPLGQVVGRR